MIGKWHGKSTMENIGKWKWDESWWIGYSWSILITIEGWKILDGYWQQFLEFETTNQCILQKSLHTPQDTLFSPCESCEQIVLRPRLEKPDLPIYQWVGPKGNTNRFPYFPIMFSYENILELVSTLKNGQLVETPTTTTIEIRSKTRYFSLKSWWKHTCSPLFHTFSIYRQGMIGPTGAPPFRPPHGTARPQRRRDRERRWDRERFRSRDLRGLLRGLFLAAGWWVNQQNMGWQKNNARMGKWWFKQLNWKYIASKIRRIYYIYIRFKSGI